MTRRLILALAMVLTVGACATKPAYFDETQAMAALAGPAPVTVS
jgi:hypothetical protein